ncbi:hypothetical protein J7M28_12665, partial [bacterium]|nr:hypothetical protein [bacterium]
PDGYPASTIGPIFISEGGQLVCGGFDRDSRVVISVFDQYHWKPYVCPFKGWDGATNIIMDRKGDIWIPHGNPGLSSWGSGVWVLCRDESAPAISLYIATNESNYLSGDSMTVSIELISDADDSRTVDFYVALEMVSGELLFYPSFGPTMAPFVEGVEIPAYTHLDDYQLFSLSLPSLPAGTYRWFAAFTHAGSMNFASNIASCEWQVE